jgi:hypothetical protein
METKRKEGIMMSRFNILYLNFERDLWKSPMKKGLYKIVNHKKPYFIVMLLDESYCMGDNYWILDQYMWSFSLQPKSLTTI